MVHRYRKSLNRHTLFICALLQLGAHHAFALDCSSLLGIAHFQSFQQPAPTRELPEGLTSQALAKLEKYFVSSKKFFFKFGMRTNAESSLDTQIRLSDRDPNSPFYGLTVNQATILRLVEMTLKNPNAIHLQGRGRKALSTYDTYIDPQSRVAIVVDKFNGIFIEFTEFSPEQIAQAQRRQLILKSVGIDYNIIEDAIQNKSVTQKDLRTITQNRLKKISDLFTLMSFFDSVPAHPEISRSELKSALWETGAMILTTESVGTWSNKMVRGEDGAYIFIGPGGPSLVINPDGKIFRGFYFLEPEMPHQYQSRWPVDYSKLKLIEN